jgi:hypothetical protein
VKYLYLRYDYPNVGWF